MSPERWRQVEELYHRASELSAENRPAFLAHACAEDAALRKQVESLLASTDDRDTYLGIPAVQRVPIQLGRYQITGCIGAGGMGAVYKGFDPAIGRTVAIKTILSNLQDSPEDTVKLGERLRREARAVGALDHPNIVTVFDVGEEAGINFIVMEFVEGVTLGKLLRQTSGLLPPEQALDILLASARALDYAHAHGVVHRDVKPANIMIRSDGEVKLADFGIAKHAAATTLTVAGNIAGTPYFLSPEQLHGHDVTPRSDQFSLAVVAWMLLTGSRPFDSEQVATLLSSILMKEPPKDRRLSHGVDAVLRRALQKDPGRRFESCVAFVEALRKASAGTLNAAPLSSARKVAALWLASAAAIALAVGLTVYSLRPKPQFPAPRRNSPATSDKVASQPPDTRAPGTKSSAPRVVSKPQKVDRTLVAGSVKVHSQDSLAYVWIPSGKLSMGCSAGDHDCAEDEKPSHSVVISRGFWMTRTETTVRAYRLFVKASGRPMPPEPYFAGRSLNPGWADAAQPIVGVTWTEAQAYCEWTGLRLPTEAEWEYAARAGNFDPSYGAPGAIAWLADNSGRAPLDSAALWRNDQANYVYLLNQNANGPHPVAQKMANAFGLHDMLGNVWEWVSDWHLKDYYAHSPDLDPSGPSSGQMKVLRGGSWYNGPRFMRASQRNSNAVETRSDYNGFRCAGQFNVNGTAVAGHRMANPR